MCARNAHFQVTDLRHHMDEQCIAGDVKRHAEENIRTALIELTAQLPISDMKLEQAVTRRQRHIVYIGGVPRAYDMAAGMRIVLNRFDNIFDLVDDFAFWPFPATPLLSVNRAKIAILIRPFIPTAHFIVLKIFDVRIAREKPNQLMHDRFLM